MSDKQLLKQLAKEHGGYRFRQHGDIGYSYQFTEPDLEAFAKAYQAAAPKDNVAEHIIKIAKSLYVKSTDNDPLVHCNRFPLWEELDQKTQESWILKAALTQDTQAKKGE